MNFIRNRNFRAGPQTSLEGFICPQNSDKKQKIKVFGRSVGGVIRLVESQFFKLKLRRASAHERAELMRNQFYFLGKNVELYTLSFGTEPYLISIHDNVICAHDVDFVNHDVSVFNAAQYLGLRRGDIDKVGSIELFENCFVGARTILMPNSSVGKNSIVAAGSIVTKHIPDNEVWGGVPAKFIMKVEDYFAKIQIQCKYSVNAVLCA